MKKILFYGISIEDISCITSILNKDEDDVHLIKNNELNEFLLDVLKKESNIDFESPEYNMSLCLFSGYTREEVFDIIDKVKKLNIKRPVFAVVTDININWKIGSILVDVNRDHMEMNVIKGYGKN